MAITDPFYWNTAVDSREAMKLQISGRPTSTSACRLDSQQPVIPLIEVYLVFMLKRAFKRWPGMTDHIICCGITGALQSFERSLGNAGRGVRKGLRTNTCREDACRRILLRLQTNTVYSRFEGFRWKGTVWIGEKSRALESTMTLIECPEVSMCRISWNPLLQPVNMC